ncbi:MAG: amino acid transporter, partial [Deltaproteobacteria bacterium]
MENNSLYRRAKRFLFGAPRDLFDPKLFHNISLVAFFAWVGLGADGISSSCYGPEEAFLALQGHTVLAIFVALATVVTVFIISGSYAQIIEAFPSGGGGYIVASKLLGQKAGVLSGSALVIDYVLTITISVAAGGDAVFSFLPLAWGRYKVVFVVL